MQFEPNHMYHIFNRGNNSQQIFFNRDNYLFFLKKIKLYIQPYADVLAWCLMPNHFHLMVYINSTEIFVSKHVTASRELTRARSINSSFSILLRSYARALQKQEKFTGSLFQHRTKAKCLTEISGTSPAWFQSAFGTEINIPAGEKEYPQICFNYIHNNPVSAGLVKTPGEWEFSSYPDYEGKRNGSLVSRELAGKFGLHTIQS